MKSPPRFKALARRLRRRRRRAPACLAAALGGAILAGMTDSKPSAPEAAAIAADTPPNPDSGPRSGPITRIEDLPKVEEIGGPPGPEPTRFGDWAIKGRVSDF